MGSIVIDKDRCKGCELCVSFCPRQLIEMSDDFNSYGLHYCVFKDGDQCTGCAVCAKICPDVAIEVWR